MRVRVLVLGGTWFLGRTVVEEALARGFDVTTFNRGRSGTPVPGAKQIHGDRNNPEDLARLAAHGPFDAVIDPSGYVPAQVGQTAAALAEATGRYVFISSVSAYTGWPVEPLTEKSPVLNCPPDADADFGYDGEPGWPTRYGFTKSGSEAAVRRVFGDAGTVILRPGVILGPWEYVGRLPWWLNRLRRGGKILAPGSPDRAIQPVDVRDAAAFALHTALAETGGTFNVAAPVGHTTFAAMLDACQQVTGSDGELVWADPPFLTEHGVRQWTELPLWRTPPGTWNVATDAAAAAGLACRPIEETVADTWAWLNGAGSTIRHERAAELGIDPDRERALVQAWEKRTVR
jgi:2'-hydroxyisoflavone reductase